MSLVTHEGFRWVTQIDPLWNAYFLGLVRTLADDIERARVQRDVVFSYRFAPCASRANLFASGAWQEFTARSAELATAQPYVVVCDIADHYSRIYHHRLENALQLLAGGSDIPARVMKFLRAFSGGPSYGLPVGGPAARLLAELSLDRIDRLLATRGVTFTRYADDYRLFASTQNEAFQALLFLSESLLGNEGLTLQRQKTRVVSSRDFLRSPLFANTDMDELTPEERQERRLLRVSLRYDPYSPTAADDYDRLKKTLEEFDILGMLTREVQKSRVNVPVARRLAQVISHLEPAQRADAAETLANNLGVLAPILPTVLRVLEEVFPVLESHASARIAGLLRAGLADGQYFLTVPVNMAYALRVLGHERLQDNISLAAGSFERAPPFIQRDIVYLMANWNATFWLSDKRRQWVNQHPWVTRLSWS